MSDQWMRDATCRDEDPDLFFVPEDLVEIPAEQRLKAERICRGCPVVNQCLLWALDHPKESSAGIWATTSPGTRRHLRNRNRKARSS